MIEVLSPFIPYFLIAGGVFSVIWPERAGRYFFGSRAFKPPPPLRLWRIVGVIMIVMGMTTLINR